MVGFRVGALDGDVVGLSVGAGDGSGVGDGVITYSRSCKLLISPGSSPMS